MAPPHPPSPLRVVVLVSGSGTLLQALLDAQAAGGAPFEVVAVGADRDGIEGLARAERHGIPAFVVALADYPTREDWNAAVAAALAAFAPDLVVLAGYMKLLGPAVLAAHRIINTHPALLPSFPGAHGVRDALAHGVKVTGTTCIWVDAGVDTGRIIAQVPVAVVDGDTQESLHERIKVAERVMLLDVVTALAGEARPSQAPAGAN